MSTRFRADGDETYCTHRYDSIWCKMHEGWHGHDPEAPEFHHTFHEGECAHDMDFGIPGPVYGYAKPGKHIYGHYWHVLVPMDADLDDREQYPQTFDGIAIHYLPSGEIKAQAGTELCPDCGGYGIAGGKGSYYDTPGRGKPCNTCKGRKVVPSEMPEGWRDIRGVKVYDPEGKYTEEDVKKFDGAWPDEHGDDDEAARLAPYDGIPNEALAGMQAWEDPADNDDSVKSVRLPPGMKRERCPSCGHWDPEHYIGIYGTEPCDDTWHDTDGVRSPGGRLLRPVDHDSPLYQTVKTAVDFWGLAPRTDGMAGYIVASLAADSPETTLSEAYREQFEAAQAATEQTRNDALESLADKQAIIEEALTLLRRVPELIDARFEGKRTITEIEAFLDKHRGS